MLASHQSRQVIALATILSITIGLSSCSSPTPASSPTMSPTSSQARDIASLQYNFDNRYTLSQAMSDNAQLTTIAFNGLAFITGDANADTFFPPGKVADFFGFQYMRDVDRAGYGHNTTFLTKAAMSILSVLDESQRTQLVGLAKTQAPTFADFAYNRLVLINAFRRALEGTGPVDSGSLDQDRIATYTSSLYRLDAQLSIGRAETIGDIISHLSPDQKASLDALSFEDSATWPDIAEDENLKKSLTNTEYQAVMTYASEMLSWYLGDVAADTYFCPERHGTYFGGFFMKDYPAMGNPDYFISTSVTGDKGKAFLEILDADQRDLITGIIDEQRAQLTDMALTRWAISEKLRLTQSGGSFDVAEVTALIEHYGKLDGELSGIYADRFSRVNASLTSDQREMLVALRDLNVTPANPYRYATEVPSPALPVNDYLFGVGQVPPDAGTTPAPQEFATGDLRQSNGREKPNK